MGARRLGLPGGHRRRVSAVANARNDAANNKMRQGGGRGLQDGADDHDGGAEHDHAPPAQRVADPDGDDGAQEAAEVVRGHRDALVRGARGLERRVRSAVRVDVREVDEEVTHRQDASHNTLVYYRVSAGLLVCSWGKESRYRNQRAESRILR